MALEEDFILDPHVSNFALHMWQFLSFLIEFDFRKTTLPDWDIVL